MIVPGCLGLAEVSSVTISSLKCDALLGSPPAVRAWSQEVAGTPFERVLGESVVEIHLMPRDGGTEVTITQRQKLRGYSRTGGLLLRRATRSKLDEALDGLQRICG
jgi:hypothetical protein